MPTPSPSGEVDVVADSTFAGVSQEPEEAAAFSDAALTADHYNEAGMRVLCCQSEEMIAVADHQNRLLRVREPEDGGVISVWWKRLSQPLNGMALL